MESSIQFLVTLSDDLLDPFGRMARKRTYRYAGSWPGSCVTRSNAAEKQHPAELVGFAGH